MRILITGANGFIGSNLVNFFSKNHRLLLITRSNNKLLNHLVLDYKDMFSEEGKKIIKNFAPTHIIHCAALAHENIRRNKRNLKFIKKINVDFPIKLYLFGNSIGVEKFIFLSSIGVHIRNGQSKKVINENSEILFNNLYTNSKIEAEMKLKKKSKKRNTILIILRPAMVYGFSCPGNFKKLQTSVEIGLPLPFKNLNNQRSFLYIGNLVSAIALCCKKCNSNKTFVIADEEMISNENLLKIISKARNKKEKLFTVSKFFLDLLSNVPFLRNIIGKLFYDLKVDSSLIRSSLNWKQPFKQNEALEISFKKNNKFIN